MKKLYKKIYVFALLIFQAGYLFSLSVKSDVIGAVKAKAAGNTKELASKCGSLARIGRGLRYLLDEPQKQQVYDTCGDIFKYGPSGKADPKNTKYKDPKAYASVAFSAPRIVEAVKDPSNCQAIGKDLFALADDDFKIGVSAGRTNFLRDVCGDYFIQGIQGKSFGEMHRNAYHKLDPNFWRTVKMDPIRASLTIAAKNSEGSMSRRAACAALAGDLPTKYLNDENKRLACLICGEAWEGKDVKAYENTCGAIAYEEKAVSGDTEEVGAPEEEPEEEPVKPVKKSKPVTAAKKPKPTEKTVEDMEAELEAALSQAQATRKDIRSQMKAKYSNK
jgi:hypothetical protein